MQGLNAYTTLRNHQGHILVSVVLIGWHKDVTKVLSVCCIPLFANTCNILASSILNASYSRHDAALLSFSSVPEAPFLHPHSGISSYVADLPLDYFTVLSSFWRIADTT